MRRTLTLLLAACAAVSALPRPDGVVAVVGDQTILISEVRDASRTASANPTLASLSPEARADRVLQQMIDEKVLVWRAKAESLDVARKPEAKPEGDDEDRNPRGGDRGRGPGGPGGGARPQAQPDDPQLLQKVEARMNELVQQSGGQDAFARELRAQTGMSPAQFRQRLLVQAREAELKDKLQEKYIGKVEPSREEVLAFYREYKDSLPVLPDQVRLSQIVLKVKADESRDSAAAREARAIVARLVAGEDFAVLARSESQDPGSAANGGDIGFMKRGDLDPAYEKAALDLEIGRWTSVPVRSRFGWHVIELTGRRDQEFRTRHILRSVMPTSSDSIRIAARADSLRQIALSGYPFADLARSWSDEKASASFGGTLGWYAENELQGQFKAIVSAIPTAKVGTPIWTGDGYVLLRVDERLAQRTLSPEEDWMQLSRLATQILTQRRLRGYVERWRKDVPIEIRLQGADLAARTSP